MILTLKMVKRAGFSFFQTFVVSATLENVLNHCIFGEGCTNSLKNLSKLNGDLKYYD